MIKIDGIDEFPGYARDGDGNLIEVRYVPKPPPPMKRNSEPKYNETMKKWLHPGLNACACGWPECPGGWSNSKVGIT